MIKNKFKILIICILPLFFGCKFFKNTNPNKPPKIAVVIVIDQFSYNYLPKLKKNLKYGLKFLIDNGIFYSNAYHPNAAPSTPVGHAAMSTGTLPKDNGFAFSYWFNDEGEKIKLTEDNNPDASVFAKNGTYDYGMSAKNLMVDTISDQFILNSKPNFQNKVFSLSFKHNASIPTAGNLGKAIWFDVKTGYFTTSKAYFNQVPKWLLDFNKKQELEKLKTTSWKLFYPKDSHYYNFYSTKNYSAAGHNFNLIDQPQKIDLKSNEPFNLYKKTPAANELLLNLTKHFINKNFSDSKDKRLLLWVSFSPLDKVGHYFGPDSLEAIDMIYHLDKQIEELINFFNKKFGKNKIVFTLTSDHGIAPIPEVMKNRGYKKSRRIFVEPIMEKLNNEIEKKYGISKLIIGFKKLQFFLNNTKLNSLEKIKQEEIFDLIKIILKKQPGIKKVWTNKELDKAVFEPYQLEYFFKVQQYPGRSGQIFCQTEPYCVLTKYKTGTSHRSPYNYDTHVPLIIYQKDRYEKKVVDQKVWIPQLAPTLAKILDITKPSATTFDTLPEI
ncbi:alkaline phosphatase family protein [Candidatus Dependentiae bacterium]